MEKQKLPPGSEVGPGAAGAVATILVLVIADKVSLLSKMVQN